jgi:hypothetical protein
LKFGINLKVFFVIRKYLRNFFQKAFISLG